MRQDQNFFFFLKQYQNKFTDFQEELRYRKPIAARTETNCFLNIRAKFSISETLKSQMPFFVLYIVRFFKTNNSFLYNQFLHK